MNPPPVLSIIVPTHNRSAMLLKSLDGLSRQSWPATQFEVVVVADACQDDTAQMVADYATRAPYCLRLLDHCARSAAATRNLGASNAQGRFLLFLDDDVVAQPGSVRAHVEVQDENRVVLGYSKAMIPQQPSWWQYDARRWWEDTYRAMGQYGHRFTYRDFFSGNVSMSAALFHKAGGFDTSFTGRLEDYELGTRLLKAGARFHFAPGAIGYHYENSDLGLWLRRVRLEGMADVQIGQRHPELRASLFGRLTGPSSRRRQIVLKLAFAQPQRGDWLEGLLLRQAALYERLRVRGRWRTVVDLLADYNYCRGVAAAIGGQRAWAAWLQEAPVPPAVASDAPVVDMAHLPNPGVLQRVLERANSTGVRLALDGVEVLTMPPQPGAEPVREEHLHRALQELAEQQFVPALGLHLIRSTGTGCQPC